jgi:hypothetical protein
MLAAIDHVLANVRAGVGGAGNTVVLSSPHRFARPVCGSLGVSIPRHDMGAPARRYDVTSPTSLCGL